MRKYGKLLLALGIVAANPAITSADGFLSGFRPKVPFTGTSQKQQNQEKAERVADALREARLNGFGIEIEVRGDTAKIAGNVKDVTHRALATRVCQSVPGINDVVNELRYVPAGNIQTASATAESNGAVRSAAFETTGNPDGEIEQVRFQKPGRRTTERSSASERPQIARPAIQPAIPRAAVNPPQFPSAVAAAPSPTPPAAGTPTNQQVAQRIADSLSQIGLTGYDIQIAYSDGVATLAGSVATVDQLQFAGATVSQVPGVQNVRNNLQVSGPIAQAAYSPRMQFEHMQQMQQMQRVTPVGMRGGNQATPVSVGGVGSYSNPHLPQHAWPAYAQYPNSAAVSYPSQYSASAWPYIGPFYPYPQVPLGWRNVALEWDDGYWQLNFNQKKDEWYWLINPKNW